VKSTVRADTLEPGLHRESRPGRGAFFLPFSIPLFHSSFFDLAGRQVMALRPGPNDVRALAPGIYFVRTQGAGRAGSRGPSEKLILQR